MRLLMLRPARLSLLLAALTPRLALAEDGPGSVSTFTKTVVTEVGKLEAANLQVTDITLSIVRDDGNGVRVPLTLAQSDAIKLIGMGDAARVADLDVAVKSPSGKVWADMAETNRPELSFTAPEAGDYEATVVLTKAAGGSGSGYFVLVTGYQRDNAPITALPLLDTVTKIADFMQTQGFEIRQGEMDVVTDKGTTAVDFQVPPGQYEGCAATAVGSPGRTKKLSLVVQDGRGAVLASGKRTGGTGALAFFSTSSESSKYRAVISARTAGSVEDTYTMLLVSCKP